MTDPNQPLEPAATVTTTTTKSVTKPEFKQISNYVGALILGGAGWVVENPQTVTALFPAPWNNVVAALIALVGASLLAYREKKTVSTVSTVSTVEPTK
jgi:hypothetical protein